MEVKPNRCSSYGGCRITIKGHGLSTDQPEKYDIRIGNVPCTITDKLDVTDTEVQCFLGDSSQRHTITNGDKGMKVFHDYLLVRLFLSVLY